MAKKATHVGHCQWCGSLQKLPGGVLAKHGYTTRHGWFQGTCHGSGHLPYELSCGLIQASIDSTRAHIRRTEAEIEQEAAVDPTTATSTWFNVYQKELSSRTRGAVYLWERRHFEQKPGDGWYWQDAKGHRHRILGLYTREAIVSYGVRQYVQHLRARIERMQKYIATQERRIKDWKPQPLSPV